MSETVRKLGLINNEKFNRLINLLEKKKDDARVLRDSTISPEEMELLESHDAMIKSAKNNSTSAGE